MQAVVTIKLYGYMDTEIYIIKKKRLNHKNIFVKINT